LRVRLAPPADSDCTRNCRTAFLEYVDSAHRSTTNHHAPNECTRSIQQSRALYSICSSDQRFSTHAGTRMARVSWPGASAPGHKTTVYPIRGTDSPLPRSYLTFSAFDNIGTCICDINSTVSSLPSQ